MPDDTAALIRGFLNETRNPHEVAALSRRPLEEVKDLMIRMPLPDLPGWGKISKQPFIISRRHALEPHWPLSSFELIKEHRRLHDMGRTNLCQGRDGVWLILYSFPLNPAAPATRPPYFYEG